MNFATGFSMAAIVVIAVGFGVVKNQQGEIKSLKTTNEDLVSVNKDLKETNDRLVSDQKEKDAINATLRQERSDIERGFQALLDSLPGQPKLVVTPQPVKPPVHVPVADEPPELDVTWRAYCKALPGGCASMEVPQ